ncbi:helix-turn-helix transcriptional regulator [Bacillus atrophaeus]|uniref:helix-turn-helix domain-containing protein n=1 Tax=Bacillus atrophaeus TaxID=1452 RepID=UPI00227DB8B5|nr:helix-turn-helix transcriptional regulator [Bacillus atrophaeus]MCY8467223.1 helix-turn-helix domain-containing protein [Bacillus atrophaeus]MCY8476424.1 helix-turn-helix domain-containing protein [Bacillus atrophaeus]MCY8495929.1 helix-turn-helix domain-containing protein [Bacillus atrophaeus]MCY8814273.1 helix-turn-helix domain-containing protein [Bacillus atrophaeus]MCY8822104.1 helix-turn-helix domain-containing protein [Bacillus atrophaeus]
MKIEKILSLTEDINNFIKIFRKQKNISSKTLANRLNKGAAYISQIENYRIKNLDEETSRQILKELNLTDAEIQTVLDHFNEKKILGTTNFPINKAVSYTSEAVNKKIAEEALTDYENPETKEAQKYFNETMEFVTNKMIRMFEIDIETTKKTLDEIMLIVDENISKAVEERIMKMMDDPEFKEQMVSVMVDSIREL